MRAVTETTAAPICGAPIMTPWARPRRSWLKALAALWREALETYAVIGRGGPPFFGGGF